MRNIKKTMYGNRIECVLFLLTIIIFTAFGAFQFPILRDHGIYSYISQELTRGNPVYSTAPDIKGPFLYMVDAFWMMIFWFMPNWVAIRIGMLIMSGLTMVFFYKTLFRMFGNKTMPLFSTIILMSFAFFAEYFVLGDPKGIALFLLMAGLYSLFSGKHLLSGISFGLMPMTWQPTGIFLLAPLIYFYLDGFDRKKTFYLFAGIALSVSFVGAHFIFTNTLPNMIEFAVLLPLEYKSGVYFKDTLIAIFNIIACYNTEIIFLAIGSLGTIYYVAKGARLLVMKRMEYAKSNKMLFAMILPYIFFSTYILADMQIADDIILQLAPISMVCGHIFYKAFIRLSFKMEKINIMFLKNSNAALIMITLMISAYSFYPALQPVYPENYIVTYAKNIEGKVAPIQIPLMTIEKYGIVDCIYRQCLEEFGKLEISQLNEKHQTRIIEPFLLTWG
ncbi:MAG: hypothetical protein QXU82_00385, partial [Candidatus Aenigmatarchaeota archaeon]